MTVVTAHPVGPVGKMQVALREFAIAAEPVVAQFVEAMQRVADTLQSMRPALDHLANQKRHTPPFWAIDPTRSKPPRR